MFVFAFLAGCVPQEDYQALQEENAKLLARVQKLDSILEKEKAQVADLQKDLKPLVDRGLLTIEVKNGKVTLSLRSDVLFAKGSADLSADGKEAVDQLARALAHVAPDEDFQVEGHTDNDPIQTTQFPSNWYLGSARGITVLNQMIADGFPRTHISASTYADTRPVADNGTAGGQQQNRRIEVVLLPDVSDLYKRLEHPGGGGGKKGKGKKKKDS